MKPEDISAFLFWLPFALATTALLGFGLWFFRPRAQRWLLPPQRLRAVPWGGAEILGLFALLELFWPAVAIELLQSVHFFGWFYGPTFPDLLKESADPNAQVIARVRVGIWAHTVALPFMAVTGPLLLALCSGTQLYQLGLHTHRLGRNL